MQPLQVRAQAENNNVPNFRSVNTGCCYHCNLLIFSIEGNKWLCRKHNIIFGYNNTEDGIANQAEFICDDFEEM